MIIFGDNWNNPLARSSSEVHLFSEVRRMSIGIYGAHGKMANSVYGDGAARASSQVLRISNILSNELFIMPHTETGSAQLVYDIRVLGKEKSAALILSAETGDIIS